MKIWTCYKKGCGHVVLSEDKPEPIKWTDGHICLFKETTEEEAYAAERRAEGNEREN